MGAFPPDVVLFPPAAKQLLAGVQEEEQGGRVRGPESRESVASSARDEKDEASKCGVPIAS